VILIANKRVLKKKDIHSHAGLWSNKAKSQGAHVPFISLTPAERKLQ
jgi:hypothetical protein